MRPAGGTRRLLEQQTGERTCREPQQIAPGNRNDNLGFRRQRFPEPEPARSRPRRVCSERPGLVVMSEARFTRAAEPHPSWPSGDE